MPGRLGVSVECCGGDGRIPRRERTGPFGGVNYPESQSETSQINLIENNNLPALVVFLPPKPKQETEGPSSGLPLGLANTAT